MRSKGLKRVLAYVLAVTMVFGSTTLDASALEIEEIFEETISDEAVSDESASDESALAEFAEDVSEGEAVNEESQIIDEESVDVSAGNPETDIDDIDFIEENADEEKKFQFLWDGTKITGFTGSPVPENLKIPSNCTSISTTAFAKNTNITKITFEGSSVTEIVKGAFEGCTSLRSVNFQNGLISIGDNAFNGCSSLEDFTLANSLKTIGASAFKGCTSLTEVTIPGNVTKIGEAAFRNCSNLTKVELDSNVLSTIGSNVFSDCDIKNLTFDEAVTKIPKTLFSYAGFDETCVVIIPANVTSIGTNAFLGSSTLKSVKFAGKKVTSIGKAALSGTSISEISIPSSVTSIGEGAFKDCANLEIVTIPEKVKTISDDAFRGCKHLSEVTIKSTALTSVGTNIFKDCYLEGVIFPEKITSIPGKLFYGATFSNDCMLHIPAKVESIGDQAFYNSTLISIVFDGVSLKKIGDQVFSSCNLVSVDIPYGCTSIGNKNFANCENLTRVSIPDSVTSIGDDCFKGSDDVTIRTPEGSTAYKYAINHKPDPIPVECNFSIVYHLNGGTNAEGNPLSYESGDDITFSPATRKGYIFTGWYTDEKLRMPIESTDERTGKLNLYAGWTLEQYEIIYDYAGADELSANVTSYDITKEVKFKNPTMKGFTFKGWYIDGKKVTGIKKGSTGDVTVTAKWEEYWYKISFKANGGKGTTASIPVRYSASKALTSNGFTREGYEFTGWNTKADGKGTPYRDEEVVSGLSGKKDGSVTLYAQWRIVDYDIFYILDGGTNSSKNPASYTVKKTVKLSNPSKKGYTFLGWFEDSSFAGVKTTGFKAGQKGDKTFYAKWSENQYKIAINKNGSDVTGAVSSPGYVGYEEGVILPDGTGLLRNGYEFTGFNTKANGAGTHYDPSEVVSELSDKKNGTVLLYVEWTPVQYGISYELYGGSNSSKNPDYYTIAQKITLANAVMDGFTFQGWYKESTYENKVTTINKGSQAEYSLHAKWSENSYKLVFDKNGGKLVGTLPAGATYKFTDAVELPLGDNLSKTGYDLTGWNTKSNGKGTHYELEDTVSGIMSANNKSVKLYAEWTPVSHDVNYYNLAGATNPNPDKHTEIANLTLKNPTKTGYTFKGWYTDAEFTHKITVIAKSDMEADVYAKWQANTYTVVFNKNGGTGTMDSFKCTYDNAYDLPDCTLTRTGYHFAGWNTKGNGTGTAYADEAEIVNLISKNGGKVILYAQWERD